MKPNLKWHRVLLTAALLPFGGVAWAQAPGPQETPESAPVPNAGPSNTEPASAASAAPAPPAPPATQAVPPAAPATVRQGPLPPLPSHAPRYSRPHDPIEVRKSQGTAHVQGVHSSLAGAWIHSTALGPLWIPHGTTTRLMGGFPHAYLYTPSYGWGWHASPWGPGPFREGPWMVRPWVSSGWGGPWITQPGIGLRIDF